MSEQDGLFHVFHTLPEFILVVGGRCLYTESYAEHLLPSTVFVCPYDPALCRLMDRLMKPKSVRKP